MRLSDLKKLRYGQLNPKDVRKVPESSKPDPVEETRRMKPLLYWSNPPIAQPQEVDLHAFRRIVLQKRCISRNLELNISAFQKEIPRRWKVLISQIKRVTRLKIQAKVAPKQSIFNDLQQILNYAKVLRRVHANTLALPDFHSLVNSIASTRVQKISLNEYKTKQMLNLLLFLHDLEIHRNLRIITFGEHAKAGISLTNLSIPERIIKRNTIGLRRLKHLEALKTQSAIFERDERLCVVFTKILSSLPKLHLFANFRFVKDQKVAEFLKGLQEASIEHFQVKWGFQENEEVSKQLGSLIKIKRLSFDFNEATPPKLIRNMRKIQGLEELTWHVNSSNQFFSTAETIVKGNMGLIEAVVQLKKLAYLDVHVYQSGLEVYKMFANGLNTMNNLKTVKVSFPYHATSLVHFFGNLTNANLENVTLSFEIQAEEEVVALGDCLRRAGKRLRELHLDLIHDTKTELAAELYEQIRSLENLEVLEIAFQSTKRGKGKQPEIGLVLAALKKLKVVNLSLCKMFSDGEIPYILGVIKKMERLKKFKLVSEMNSIKNGTMNKIKAMEKEMPDNLKSFEVLFPQAKFNFVLNKI